MAPEKVEHKLVHGQLVPVKVYPKQVAIPEVGVRLAQSSYAVDATFYARDPHEPKPRTRNR